MADDTYEVQRPGKPGLPPAGTTVVPPNAPVSVVVNVPSPNRGWAVRLLIVLLLISVMFNIQANSEREQYFSSSHKITEKYHSGSKETQDRIARIVVSGTIMPPFSRSVIDMIEQAREDENVKGVLLVVDSPGGLVTDSHQIYHQLKKLSAVKPVYVSMKDMAASGGLYIAMGVGTKGKIYAEPTTWTGSIGVILPRYNAAELAKNLGVKAEPIKTGPLKDSLSPFRDLTEQDLEVWTAIIDDAFVRFIGVIDENRDSLDEAKVRELATGQVYTATQAKANGLVDEIGFEDDALAALQKQLGLTSVRIVDYEGPVSLLDVLTGSAKAQTPEQQWSQWMEMTVPRAMYFCSWLPVMPGLAE